MNISMNIIKAAQAGLLAVALGASIGAVAQNASNKSEDKSATDKSAKSAAKSDDKKAGAARLSTQDRNFVMKAAQGGLAEVETGKLASAQAGDASIKQFGEKMVQDHGKANDELTQIAKGKGIQPPSAPDASHQAVAKRLQGLKGAEFDRAYAAAMVKDHDETLKLFQAQAKSGQDAELKSFAEKTLPTLEEHARMAHELHANSAGSDKGSKGSKGDKKK
jgi:putative membrane protein